MCTINRYFLLTTFNLNWTQAWPKYINIYCIYTNIVCNHYELILNHDFESYKVIKLKNKNILKMRSHQEKTKLTLLKSSLIMATCIRSILLIN